MSDNPSSLAPSQNQGRPLLPRATQDSPDFTCCDNDTVWARCGRLGIFLVRWFPIFFVYGLAVFSIYFFSVSICIDYLLYGENPKKVQGALYLAVFWFLLVMVVLCFTRAAFGSAGSPGDYNIRITSTQEEELAAMRPDQFEPVSPGQVIYIPRHTARVCGLCNFPKPPRTHHCSTCGRCSLKMDHHCVWLDNCVGFHNYKAFLLLLLYGWLFCGFVFGATLDVLIEQLVNDTLSGVSVVYLVMDVLAFALGLSTLLLFGYHFYLVGCGMTTIEHMERQEELEDLKRRARYQSRHGQASGPLPTPTFINYSEGWSRNYRIVFGRKWWLWWVPFGQSLGNGIRFPREAPVVMRVEPV